MNVLFEQQQKFQKKVFRIFKIKSCKGFVFGKWGKKWVNFQFVFPTKGKGEQYGLNFLSKKINYNFNM
jgi:hypothetical protein